jgi:hypothetical protein
MDYPRRVSRQSDVVPVAVRAVNFVTLGGPVAGARISVLGESTRTIALTDAAGRATLYRTPGEKLTLLMEKAGFVTTQSATVQVPPEGLSGPHTGMTFQTVWTWFLRMTKSWLRVSTQSGRHHLVATVTGAGKTLDDLVQGEPGAKVSLFSEGRRLNAEPIYLGIVPLLHITDFFLARWRLLDKTSADGGVIFPNVEPGAYTIRAEHPSRIFSECNIVVREESPEFVNASPPWGPRVID